MSKYKYDSFVLHYEQYKIVETLSLNDEQKGKLLDLIFGYAKDGTIPANTPDLVKGAFAGIKVRMDEDREKYNAKRERMDKINDERKNNENARNRNDVETKSHENGGITVTDSVTDSVSDSVAVTGCSKEHTHPKSPSKGKVCGVASSSVFKLSLSDVKEYIENRNKEGQKGYTFSAEEFIRDCELNGMKTKKGVAITSDNWRLIADNWAAWRESHSVSTNTKSRAGVRYDNEQANFKNDEL